MDGANALQGVNHAFAGVRDLSNLIRSLSPPVRSRKFFHFNFPNPWRLNNKLPNLRGQGADPLPERVRTAAVMQHNEALLKRAGNLVQFQLFAMYE
jgi:hypothetical protein